MERVLSHREQDLGQEPDQEEVGDEPDPVIERRRRPHNRRCGRGGE
jgi:hypothetical protein